MKMRCPSCGKPTLEPKKVPNFHTRFEGVKIVVLDAEWLECYACGEKLYHATELKRWRDIKRRKK